MLWILVHQINKLNRTCSTKIYYCASTDRSHPTFCISAERLARSVYSEGRVLDDSGWLPSGGRKFASCTKDSFGRTPKGEKCLGEAPARCTLYALGHPTVSRDVSPPRRTCTWPSPSPSLTLYFRLEWIYENRKRMEEKKAVSQFNLRVD